uniref:Uncharacterized protein n=1 Tax=Anguilla anguilla TaxID=7936 RepID=A0A0E9RS53_ANGAN
MEKTALLELGLYPIISHKGRFSELRGNGL